MHALQAVKFGTLVSTPTSAVTTTSGGNIDCGGNKADYCTVIVNLSAEKNTDATGVTLSVLANDTTVVSNFATVTANRTEDLTTAHSVFYNIPVTKRYIRVTATPDTTTNGNVEVGINYILSRLEGTPSADSGRVVSTHDVCVTVS